jgi:hypothetical protein
MRRETDLLFRRKFADDAVPTELQMSTRLVSGEKNKQHERVRTNTLLFCIYVSWTQKAIWQITRLQYSAFLHIVQGYCIETCSSCSGRSFSLFTSVSPIKWSCTPNNSFNPFSLSSVTITTLADIICCVIYVTQFTKLYSLLRPPPWSSGQSSWLQIPRPGFDSRHYQKKKVVVLERGPLIPVSTTEVLLDRKVAAPV